jgi:Spy/CpxP family protein refolding chaperone
MKRVTIIYTITVVLLLTAFAVVRADTRKGQGWVGHRWHHSGPMSYLAHELKLSDEQRAQIQTLWRQELPAISAHVHELLDENKEMNAIAAQANPDQSAVQQVAERQGKTIASLLVKKRTTAIKDLHHCSDSRTAPESRRSASAVGIAFGSCRRASRKIGSKIKTNCGENSMPLHRRFDFSLLALILIYAALLKVGGSNVRIAFQVPHDAAIASDFVTQHSWEIRLGSFAEFGSAISLSLFIAICLYRLRLLRISSAGEQIATFGGIATPIMLAGSAMATWSLTRPGVAAAPGAVQALQSLGFDGGGPGFAVFFGLFVGGVSIAAGLHKLIPRWLMWWGIAVAAAGELSLLTLLNFTAGYFIPVLRFLSIVWMLGLAWKLPRDCEAVAKSAAMNVPIARTLL